MQEIDVAPVHEHAKVVVSGRRPSRRIVEEELCSRCTTALGYWLGEEFQGRGLVTAACRRLVAHSFDVLRLHRVEIRCAVENHRSRAIPERLGFRLEGRFREAEWLYDHWVDHAVYALLTTDRGEGDLTEPVRLCSASADPPKLAG